MGPQNGNLSRRSKLRNTPQLDSNGCYRKDLPKYMRFDHASSSHHYHQGTRENGDYQLIKQQLGRSPHSDLQFRQWGISLIARMTPQFHRILSTSQNGCGNSMQTSWIMLPIGLWPHTDPVLTLQLISSQE